MKIAFLSVVPHRVAPLRCVLAVALPLCVVGLTGCDGNRDGQIDLDPASAAERDAENEAYSAEMERQSREGIDGEDGT